MSDREPAQQRSNKLLTRLLAKVPAIRGLTSGGEAQSEEQGLRAVLQAHLRALTSELEAMRATAVEVAKERADWQARTAQLQDKLQALMSDREALRATKVEVARERAELQARTALLQDERDHWRQAAQALSQGFDGLFQSLVGQFSDARSSIAAEMHILSGHMMATRAALDAGLRDRSAQPVTGGGHAVALYLDLLESSLTGMLNEDGSISPWTAGTYDPARRALGRDWPATACTMIGTARMRNLRHLLERALAEDVPGDFIETGVWRGGACIYARGILAAHGDTTRRVFVADSFRGLPEPDAEAFPADAGDQHSTFEQLAISRDQVAENFRRYGLLDERVVFLEGWFKDTLPTAPIERLAVLRLDGDMYESTIQALDALYDKVSPGGYVIVDDYILDPCARAIEDFRAARGITASLEPVDGAAVWWQVPR